MIFIIIKIELLIDQIVQMKCIVGGIFFVRATFGFMYFQNSLWTRDGNGPDLCQTRSPIRLSKPRSGLSGPYLGSKIDDPARPWCLTGLPVRTRPDFVNDILLLYF
jgi:hypothetical protein